MEQPNLPILKFKPILKSAIWGGEKIAPLKGIVTDQTQIGESWEVSGVKGNESVVAEGPLAGKTLTELVETYKGALVGERVYEAYGNTFPLLIKIIDAAGDLSLQVHPDDKLAKERHNSLGKTEMWYIVDTEPGAIICAGLSKEVTKEEYAAKVADNTLMDVVAHHKSHPGDVFFLPAGRIHSIGAGNLLVEVQETSDITYRIYDFGRVDAKTGKPRQLHVEEAKDAIDFTVHPDYVTKPEYLFDNVEQLVECSHFCVYKNRIEGSREFYSIWDSFATFTCIEGDMIISDDRDNSTTLRKGETVLVPAQAKTIKFKGNGVVIGAISNFIIE